MIITLTMNPAIDKTVTVKEFTIDHVNRISDVHLDAAGKGINVSKVVKNLGGRTKTIAFLGGSNGDFIEKSLQEDHVTLVKIPVEGQTRINTKIVDPIRGTFTDINEAGPKVEKAHVDLFINQLISHSSSQTTLVLTGSLPPGMPSSVYRDLIEQVSAFGATTVLDASGESFRQALKAKPTIVKPNIHELEQYLGHKLSTEHEIIEAGRHMINDGVEIVVISLGHEGAVMVTKDKVLKAKGLNVDVKSTVGAGDAMVAALCYGYEKKFPLDEIFNLAIASSAAQVSVKGTKPPSLDLIYKLRKQVEIIEI